MNNRLSGMKKDFAGWFVFSCAILASALTLCAQTYSVDWYKIAGGGGSSTGGVYTISGTIGQPDAGGPMSNGQFSLTGGFWSLISLVQSPGAPLLSISYAGNQAIVSWPSLASGWTLQTNSNLGTGAWGDYSGPIGNNRVTNAPPSSRLFFRLKQP
jgi:hypothetical protein